MKKKESKPTFPRICDPQNGNIIDEPGISIRDYFACKAMQSMVAWSGAGDPDEIVEGAYKIADAMVKYGSA